MTPTFVTCLYDLAKRGHASHRTIDWMFAHSQYVMELPHRLVMFCDEELETEVRKRRQDRPTIFVTSPTHASPYEWVKDNFHDKISAATLQSNARRQKVTPLYVMLMWAKYAMLREALRHPQLVDAEAFGWIDCAITHVAKPAPYSVFEHVDPARIHVHAMRLFDAKVVNRPDYWRSVHGHLSGGLAIGSRASMEWLTDKFFETAAQALDRGLAVLDEGILSYIAGTEPERFRLSYGDYEDILHNHDQIRGGHRHLRWMLATGDADRQGTAELRLAIFGQNKPLLGLVMITKDESARIAEVLGTYKSIIDFWSILDTGSTDGTQDIIRRELAGIPGDLHEEPFVDFATSRNRALELHGTKTTFAIMPNGDSLVGADALRTFLEARRNDGATAYKIRIAPGHYYHPLVMRTGHGWHYAGRTHECLMGDGVGSQIPDVMLLRDRSQRTDAEWKARWLRDVELLKLDIADNPSSPRGYFYLGQTYDGLGKYEDALTYYQKRAAMHGYFDETFEAKLRIGKMRAKLEQPWDQIMGAYLDAHTFDPRRAEPLCYIADHYHGTDNHALAYLFASRAAEIPKPATDLFLDEDVYSHRAAEIASIHAFYTPTVPRANGRRFAERAVRGRPHDERLRANWAFYARSSAELFGAKTTAIDFVAEAPYVASTPSICHTTKGWRAVVRTVNYRIVNGQYLYPNGDNAIRTRNYMLELEEREGQFKTTRTIEMADVSDRPRTDYIIHGYEDCRLFEHGGRLYATATVCDLTEDGKREIVLMHLREGDYAIEKVVPLRGAWSHAPQKNWMPLLSSRFTTYSSCWDPINGPSIDPIDPRSVDPMKIIYAAVPGQPATIFTIDPNVGVIGDPPVQLGHGRLRGGSQAIPFEYGFLCLVHDVAFTGGSRMYLHRFVRIGTDHKIVAMTDPFYFEKLGVEFAAGLDYFAKCNKFVASYSVADASARLATFEVERVFEQLKTDYVP